jgi:hypothetical protein
MNMPIAIPLAKNLKFIRVPYNKLQIVRGGAITAPLRLGGGDEQL